MRVIKIHQTDKEVCLQFTVSDTGMGIPINKQSMILGVQEFSFNLQRIIFNRSNFI